METVSFTRMEDGTREDYELLERLEREYAAGTADRVLAQLRELRGSLGGYRIDRLEHSLQTATRAYRHGADTELVVAALLHDIGDLLAPHNHSQLAAVILKPYVSRQTHWIIRHHGLFQTYYYAHHSGGDRHARDRYREHPGYQATVDFCQLYDQPSFDPDYNSLPLDFFEPMARQIFAREPYAARQ